jgi:hypothetical protein
MTRHALDEVENVGLVDTETLDAPPVVPPTSLLAE